MCYFFMVELIRVMEGDLLGVEIIIYFVLLFVCLLYFEFVILLWDNLQKCCFLFDLLWIIVVKYGWFLCYGLFCIVNIDWGMVQFVFQDKDICVLLYVMLFVELQVVEYFLC